LEAKRQTPGNRETQNRGFATADSRVAEIQILTFLKEPWRSLEMDKTVFFLTG